MTAAALFRVVEGYRPTLLVDEADTFLAEADELRGVLNSGHRKGGQVLRTVGDDHEPRSFSTFAAVAIAIIGNLPDTLADRSVTVDLKRRLPSETVESFRFDRVAHLDVLARQAARWAPDNAAPLPRPTRTCRASTTGTPTIGPAARHCRRSRRRVAGAGARRGAGRARSGGDDASLVELLLGDIRDTFSQAKEEQGRAGGSDIRPASWSRPWSPSRGGRGRSSAGAASR